MIELYWKIRHALHKRKHPELHAKHCRCGVKE